MLTGKQRELLELLERCQTKGQLIPSFDEMKEMLGLKSKSGIHRLISGLEERGYIRRLPHRARALEVVKSLKEKAVAAAAEMISVPIYGKIAAGTPIEALHDRGDVLDLPPAMVRKGKHYALEVSGDSMVEAGIMDGDIAIIRETHLADNGAIVVAFIPEQNEATLKTFFKDGRNIRLEPANRHYKTQTYPAQKVQVQGQLAGIYRRY